MKKILLLFTLILLQLPIYSEETGSSAHKKFSFLVRRQNTILYPYETYRFPELYKFYKDDRNNSAGNILFGFYYHFPEDKYRIEFHFNEIHNSDLSKSTFRCSNNSQCYTTPYSIGNYYRLSSEINFYKNWLDDKVSLGGGLRGVQSNLSLGFPFSYDMQMTHKAIGPNLSLKLRTPELWGFSIGARLDAFLLRGIMGLEIQESSRTSPWGFNRVDSYTPTINAGTESDISLNYSLTEQIQLSIGGSRISMEVSPTNKHIISLNPARDLETNLFMDSGNYRDVFSSTYFQVKMRF